MTADEQVRALELERVRLRPGRHMTAPTPNDHPLVAAERLAAVTADARAYDWEPARKNRQRYYDRMRRRAVDRAREAAGR